MALNPFFLQGSASEQRLVQDLINEQLKIYGVEVYYMPRKFIGSDSIMRENIVAKFDDSFAFEAYVQNYEGFAGSGDLMTKFGVRTTDELTLVISKERYEDFISSFYADGDGDTKLTSRPKEGDLIYFPLSDSLFEIKFVEHEQPFYQLGKLYMYELKCELFEVSDEIIDTGVVDIDDNLEDEGYIATLTLAGYGATALYYTGISTNNGVNTITLINDGFGYTSPPAVAISTSPSGENATAVAITTAIGAGSTSFSVKEIVITNSGYGYTQAPTVTISGAGGSGAIARAGIGTNVVKILRDGTQVGGSKYAHTPTVAISTSPVGVASANATAVAIVGAAGTVMDVRFTNAGFGYTVAPIVTIQSPGSVGMGTGNFFLNEMIRGQSSLTTARVKNWDADTNILKISHMAGNFALNEVIVGSATTGEFPGMGSTATYTIYKIGLDDQYDAFAENIVIENEADSGLVDFSEGNPFGSF